jgi:hypothetical protein
LVPTISGMLFILVLIGLILYFVLQNVAHFLAVSEPSGAKYLVVEGWLSKDELNQAFKLFDDHDYQNVIVTGGPISDEFNEHYLNYSERAAAYMKSIGFPNDKIIVVSSPYSAQERTFLSAVMVREWFFSENIEVHSLDVFSGDVHSRRTRSLYQIAFDDEVNIGILASKPNDFDLSRWWQSSDAATSVLKELTGLIFMKCCFNPGAEGSHYEKWGVNK